MSGIRADLFSSGVLRDQGSLQGLCFGLEKRLGNTKREQPKHLMSITVHGKLNKQTGKREAQAHRRHRHDHVRYGGKTNNQQRPNKPHRTLHLEELEQLHKR